MKIISITCKYEWSICYFNGENSNIKILEFSKYFSMIDDELDLVLEKKDLIKWKNNIKKIKDVINYFINIEIKENNFDLLLLDIDEKYINDIKFIIKNIFKYANLKIIDNIQCLLSSLIYTNEYYDNLLIWIAKGGKTLSDTNINLYHFKDSQIKHLKFFKDNHVHILWCAIIKIFEDSDLCLNKNNSNNLYITFVENNNYNNEILYNEILNLYNENIEKIINAYSSYNKQFFFIYKLLNEFLYIKKEYNKNEIIYSFSTPIPEYLYNKSMEPFKDVSKNIAVFWNCETSYTVFNYIQKKKIFNNIKTIPSYYNSGNSYGAILNYNKKNINIDYKGCKPFDSIDILNNYNLKYYQYTLKDLGKLLYENNIIGVFKGLCDIGKRGLGSRSILCNPFNKHLINKLHKIKNSQILTKYYNIIIPYDYLNNYFIYNNYSPYATLYNTPIDKKFNFIDKKNRIKYQSIKKENNEWLYSLLLEFQKLSTYPFLINTTLAKDHEPMYNYYEKAIKLYIDSDMDGIIIEDRLYLK